MTIVFGLGCCSIMGWTAIKVVTWAQDLPNRILIDGDGLADALGNAVTQSYHEALINGDAQMQGDVIKQLTIFAEGDSAAAEWVRTEYSADLAEVASSQDTEIATRASKLIEILMLAPTVDSPHHIH